MFTELGLLGLYHTGQSVGVSVAVFESQHKASLTHSMSHLGVNLALYEQYLDSGKIKLTLYNDTLPALWQL